jgi:hypothetical protein
VGRHSAADGASVDPVVAAALARRSSGAPAHRGDDGHAGVEAVADDAVAEHGGERDTARLTMGPMTAEQSGSAVGWPAPPEREPSPGGLGWPGGMPDPARQGLAGPATDDAGPATHDAGPATHDAGPATHDAVSAVEDPAGPETPARPRGWRRLFRAA